MDWSQILRHLQGQGPVIWAAAAAVATGASLLAGAAVLHWRRRGGRRPATDNRVRLTDTGYAAAPPPVPATAMPPAPAAADDPRLLAMGVRLSAAAARLEELRARRNAAASALKASTNRVEYVHRSGRA